jgi:hypothetical protein
MVIRYEIGTWPRSCKAKLFNLDKSNRRKDGTHASNNKVDK